MDIQLPVMDGYEATRRIRSNPELKSIPIIAVTSYALAGDEAKALAVGCNAYVTKPFSPRALLAKVQEHLALVECTAAYSITSSARASSEGGMLRSRALAALRFIMSVYFVGC
jgi:DNA-binding response OmpR family regulator